MCVRLARRYSEEAMRYIIAIIFMFIFTWAQAKTLKCEVKSIVGSALSGEAVTPADNSLIFTGKVGDVFLFNTKTGEIEGAPLMAKFFNLEDSERFHGANKSEEKGIYYHPHTDGHVWIFKVFEFENSKLFQNYDTWTGRFISGSCGPVL